MSGLRSRFVAVGVSAFLLALSASAVWAQEGGPAAALAQQINEAKVLLEQQDYDGALVKLDAAEAAAKALAAGQNVSDQLNQIAALRKLAQEGKAAVTVSPEDAKYRELLERLRKEKEVEKKYKELVAEHYYKVAQQRYDNRLFEEAEENLRAALDANPQHAKARELLMDVRRVLGKTEEGAVKMIDRVMTDKLVQIRYEVENVRRAIREAKQLLGENRFAQAMEKLDVARDSVKVLSMQVDLSRERAEIDSLTEKAQAAKDKAEKEAEQKKRDEALEVARREQERLQGMHQERIDRLFEDAKNLYEQTRYELAAKKAEEILKIDPRNEAVIAFRKKALEAQRAADIAWYQETSAAETDETWRRVRKLAIPFTDVQPRYPDDWDQKRKRKDIVYTIRGESTADAEWRKNLSAILEEPVSFDFIATPLDDVVAFFRNLKKVNIVVDKQAVADHGDLDVTLRLDKVPFKDALAWILRLVNLKYALQNNAIFISTKENIAKIQETDTRIYYVTDLTAPIRDFKANTMAISNTGLDDEGGGFEDIFAEEKPDEAQEVDQFTGDSLVEFIKAVIAPGTWEDVGIGVGGL